MSPNDSCAIDSKYLWIQVCEQLKCHNKGSDRCIDTLNRLWRKNPRVRAQDGALLLDVPLLTENMLVVRLEQWSLPQLEALEPPHDRDELRSFAPIIVLNWFDRFFLIDGNTRVNFWKKIGNQGPHAVLRICEVKGDI